MSPMVQIVRRDRRLEHPSLERRRQIVCVPCSKLRRRSRTRWKMAQRRRQGCAPRGRFQSKASLGHAGRDCLAQLIDTERRDYAHQAAE
jgi:hypothetical protein